MESTNTPAIKATDEQPRPEQVLRRLLAYRVAGALLYADDGELLDNTAQPCIDFKRDSVDALETKLGNRTRAALTPSAIQAIPKWQERMPAPRMVKQCSMNCSPSNPPCEECWDVAVNGDPIKARDEEIAELRAALNLTKG
jgi:hypothetical protein